MHILISCAGSAGDVHPFIAIGQTLKARGHDVHMLTSPYFQDRIERAGLGFSPIGTLADYERAVSDPDLWHPQRAFNVVWRNISPLLMSAYETTAAHIGPDTVLVSSTLAWGPRLVQEKWGTPAATVHLSPACLMSAKAPAHWQSLAWLQRSPAWLVEGVLRLIDRWVMDRTVLPHLNRVRATLDLPPVRHAMRYWCHSPQKVICAFPDWFAAPQTDWPMNSVTTGFPLLAASSGAVLDPMLVRFLTSGPPPIVFTPGSAMAHGRTFFERALAACFSLGRRAVFVTPYRDQLPATLPASVRHAAYVPFDLLAPHAAAFVHHGGIGTSAQCLAAGVPQLITPFAHDQFDNGDRLKRLGVADVIAPDADATAWAKALMRLTSDRAVADACNDMAGRMARTDALNRIADEIETLGHKATILRP